MMRMFALIYGVWRGISEVGLRSYKILTMGVDRASASQIRT